MEICMKERLVIGRMTAHSCFPQRANVSQRRDTDLDLTLISMWWRRENICDRAGFPENPMCHWPQSFLLHVEISIYGLCTLRWLESHETLGEFTGDYNWHYWWWLLTKSETLWYWLTHNYVNSPHICCNRHVIGQVCASHNVSIC